MGTEPRRRAWAVRSDANSCSRVRAAPSVFDSSGAEVEGQHGEHVTTTKPAFQAVTSNRTASDLSACKWLRTPDVKPHTDNPERVGTSCHPVPRPGLPAVKTVKRCYQLLSTRRPTYRLTDLTLTSLRVPTHTYCKRLIRHYQGAAPAHGKMLHLSRTSFSSCNIRLALILACT